MRARRCCCCRCYCCCCCSVANGAASHAPPGRADSPVRRARRRHPAPAGPPGQRAGPRGAAVPAPARRHELQRGGRARAGGWMDMHRTSAEAAVRAPARPPRPADHAAPSSLHAVPSTAACLGHRPPHSTPSTGLVPHEPGLQQARDHLRLRHRRVPVVGERVRWRGGGSREEGGEGGLLSTHPPLPLAHPRCRAHPAHPPLAAARPTCASCWRATPSAGGRPWAPPGAAPWRLRPPAGRRRARACRRTHVRPRWPRPATWRRQRPRPRRRCGRRGRPASRGSASLAAARSAAPPPCCWWAAWPGWRCASGRGGRARA